MKLVASDENRAMCRSEENGAVMNVLAHPLYARRCYLKGNVPITHGKCKWEIKVEGSCDPLSIGLATFVTRTDSKWKHGAKRQRWCQYLWSGGYLTTMGEDSRKPYGKEFGKNVYGGTTVLVHVNMVRRTCKFSIDGQKFGEAFSDLPDEVFPVVCVTVPCKVSIQLVSDPAFL